MSDVIVSVGSLIVVTVFRPARGSEGIGTRRMIAQTPLGAPHIATAIAERLPVLFEEARLPALLLPTGAPLTMLLQVFAPDGQLASSASSADILRAAPLAEMLAAWTQDLPAIVSRFLATAEHLFVKPDDAPPAPVVH